VLSAPPPRRVLLLGGTSEIGLAVLRALPADPARTFVLAGRDREALAAAGRGLPGGVELADFEARDEASRRRVLDLAFAGGPVDTVLAAFGVLGDQGRAERDPAHAEEVLTVDLVAQAGVLLDAAARMARQGGGTLVVFSSVAAVRARRANFVYGAGKAGLDAFACGLADRLHGTSVRVLLVRPGFVTGRMTAGLPPAPLATDPERVAAAVVAALAAGTEVVWVPGALRYLALALRLVPRPLWRRVRR
jgi:decaprenylphospho-beta-D-erythro-pentofuranosid-2-ulose 2-reductase